MVFPWFSHGFPIVFLWFSSGFPIDSPFSHGFIPWVHRSAGWIHPPGLDRIDQRGAARRAWMAWDWWNQWGLVSHHRNSHMGGSWVMTGYPQILILVGLSWLSMTKTIHFWVSPFLETPISVGDEISPFSWVMWNIGTCTNPCVMES